jgi:hypothetical protein
MTTDGTDRPGLEPLTWTMDTEQVEFIWTETREVFGNKGIVDVLTEAVGDLRDPDPSPTVGRGRVNRRRTTRVVCTRRTRRSATTERMRHVSADFRGWVPGWIGPDSTPQWAVRGVRISVV